MGDAVLTDEFDQSGNIGCFTNHDRLATVVLTGRCPTATTDVEERHGNEVDCMLVHLPEVTRGWEDAHEVLVREHDTLRTTRGAAGVQLEGDVAGLGLSTWIDCLIASHP